MGSHLIILAAGSSLNSKDNEILWPAQKRKRVLDYQIETFKLVRPDAKISIAVSSDYKSIASEYQNISFLLINETYEKSILNSLSSIPLDNNDEIVIMYGDTIYHSSVIFDLLGANCEFAYCVDSNFYSKHKADIETTKISNRTYEFCGLVKFSENSIQKINEISFTGYKKLSEIVNSLILKKLNSSPIFITGRWRELNSPRDLKKFFIGTKAQTLFNLQPIIKSASILDSIVINFLDWKKQKSVIIQEIAGKFTGKEVIIRSSSKMEDCWDKSNAGAFLTIKSVPSSNAELLEESVSKVFSSYLYPDDDEEVLVQEMLVDVKSSGVVFTAEINTGSPYISINYDNKTGRTDSVTSGDGQLLSLIKIYKKPNDRLKLKKFLQNKKLYELFKSIKEIEKLLDFANLDIEFAINNRDEIFILQVRPLVIHNPLNKANTYLTNDYISDSVEYFKSVSKDNLAPKMHSHIYSNMADWNPAEIIGIKPKPLPVSLYKYIVTDSIWAEQRFQFGYRDLRKHKLMKMFCGQPYIDCNLSINSFIPRALSEPLSIKLQNAYISILKSNPELHDKIELNLVFTTIVYDFHNKAYKRLKDYGLTRDDIKEYADSLREITKLAFNKRYDFIKNIKVLEKKFEQIKKLDCTDIQKAFLLIENVKENGTLPFSHAARLGFVAIDLLNSLEENGFLKPERRQSFQKTIKTITSEYYDEIGRSSHNLDYLIKKYGHLRPGTYDLDEPAYWEKADFFFQKNPTANNDENFSFTDEEIKGIESFIENIQLDISYQEFIDFIKFGVFQRENVKFQFTKNVSFALDLIITFCQKELGLDRSSCNFLDVKNLEELANAKYAKKQILDKVISRKKEYKLTSLINLPSIINHESDFWFFEEPFSSGNFITLEKISANKILLDCSIDYEKINLENKIIFIENSDPGFDWIFSHHIKGLVTKYGGANSHMAIRCAELSIPACIVIGKIKFDSLSSEIIYMDCKNKKIENA